MTLAEAKKIINENPDSVNKFRVYFQKVKTGTNDFFPPVAKAGLPLKEAANLARRFYKASYGRFINIEVKRDTVQ